MSKKSKSAQSKLVVHKEKVKGAAKHPFIVPVITVVFLSFFTLIGSVFIGAETLGPADSRVVTVYEDGQEQTLPTRAKTVGDLLERLDITVSKNDIVEPSRSTKILEDGFTVNVYKSRLVTIVDGEKEITTESAQQSARAIAKEQGLKLFAEDIVDVNLPEDVLDQTALGEQIIIERSVPVKLVLFGQSYNVRTHADSIAELLEEKEINKNDVTVFPSARQKIKKSSVVYVTSPGKRIVSKEEVIPFEEEVVQDEDLPLGTEQVQEPGKDGKRIVLYEIDKKTKKRKKLQVITAFAPKPRVIARGTGVLETASLTGSKADWMRSAGIDPSQFVYVDNIIARESGWDPGAVSSNRCIGLGQRCSAQILISACPAWQNDPVCQLRHFSDYANGRYGSWQNAYSFWQANHWW